MYSKRMNVDHPMFDIRGKGPQWPTFKKAPIHLPESECYGGDGLRSYLIDEDWQMRLEAMPRLIYTAIGRHQTQETKTGGFHASGEKKWYPAWSFEKLCYVQRNDMPRKTRLYFLGWIGAYMNGCILHIGPQWPHVGQFDADEVAYNMYRIYTQIALILYEGRTMDRDVKKFLTKSIHGNRALEEISNNPKV